MASLLNSVLRSAVRGAIFSLRRRPSRQFNFVQTQEVKQTDVMPSWLSKLERTMWFNIIPSQAFQTKMISVIPHSVSRGLSNLYHSHPYIELMILFCICILPAHIFHWTTDMPRTDVYRRFIQEKDEKNILYVKDFSTPIASFCVWCMCQLLPEQR